ncbi:MAG: hypothetical protein AAF432_10690 [Planctomycetota bacterium]
MADPHLKTPTDAPDDHHDDDAFVHVHCVACGYTLSGHAPGVVACPECGFESDPSLFDRNSTTVPGTITYESALALGIVDVIIGLPLLLAIVSSDFRTTSPGWILLIACIGVSVLGPFWLMTLIGGERARPDACAFVLAHGLCLLWVALVVYGLGFPLVVEVTLPSIRNAPFAGLLVAVVLYLAAWVGGIGVFVWLIRRTRRALRRRCLVHQMRMSQRDRTLLP